MPSPISEKLIPWYQRHKRAWPWRDNPDPYAAWVSEVMAQQTRLDTMLPYFQRWMARFPTTADLAAASQQEVLNLWEGLGYYSRARNLHKAAQVVVEEYGGELPNDVDELIKLPGIGRYTAGAVASLAFGLDEPVVDGNVKRVLARVFDVQEAVDSSAGGKRIWELARQHLPPGKAGTYNQALMDLGAGVCLPRSPDCGHCPISDLCQANQLGLQAELPRKKPKAEVPHHTVAAGVIWRGGKVLIAQRPADGLLGGMWEFPGGKREDGEDLPACLRRELDEELAVRVIVGNEIGVFKHAYTHFRVTLHAFSCKIKVGKPTAHEAQQIVWVTLDQLDDYPMGKLDRLVSRRLLELDA